MTTDGIPIGPGLALPLDAVTETFAFLAKRGKGKTYCASVMVEGMYDAGLPVCVIDPLGVWWGLRSSADGQGEGLPFIVFGGEHADVPLEESAGAVLADFVVDQRAPVVFDLSLLSKSAARRFVAAFLERLYHRNREPLHVVLDEADEWAPQRTSSEGARLLGTVQDLVRRGRARGLGCTLITQRPAVLNKDVLTQAEVLFAFGMTGVRDVQAIDEWVRLHADDDQAAEVKASLPSLPRGTAWVWSPGWLDTLQKVEVQRRRTFDSSATPKVGEVRAEPRRFAPVDLAALGERIAATVDRAKAEDPKALRARVADLERQLAAAVADRPEPERVEVEVPVLTDDDTDLLRKVTGLLLRITPPEVVPIGEHRSRRAEATVRRAEATAPPADAAPPPADTSVRPPDPVPAAAPPRHPDGTVLPKAQRAILTVLAQHGDRTVQQVAILTGYAANGGGFRNSLGALRTAGHITGSGTLSLTDGGREALGTYTRLPTGPSLVIWWSSRLSRAEVKALDVIVAQHPRAVPVADVAAAAGYEATGGGFRNALGRLRTLGLITGRGEVRAADELAG